MLITIGDNIPQDGGVITHLYDESHEADPFFVGLKLDDNRDLRASFHERCRRQCGMEPDE